MAKPYRRKNSPYWWIAPMINGKQRPQSSETTNYDDAMAKLQQLCGAIAQGQPITHRTGRCTFDEIAADMERNYAIKRRRSAYDLNRRIEKHLRPFFGGVQISKITTTMIEEFTLARQKEGAKNMTINMDLSALKRMFTLAIRSGKAVHRPYIEMLPVDNIREGFFEPDQFAAIMAHANPLLQAVMTVCYVTGWRISSVLALEWRHVNFAANHVSTVLSKNKKAVAFPLKWGLREVFEERKRATMEAQAKTGTIIPYVFHTNGKPARNIRTAFINARNAAGIPGRIIHDFRRTAVRNLLDAGIQPTDIMALVGFKTMSMFMRYSITTNSTMGRISDMMDRAANGTAAAGRN